MFVELRLVIAGQKLNESENECVSVSCELREATCSKVFEGRISWLKLGVDFNQHEAEIINALEDCPQQRH